ncbi:hypothetical protein [Neorhizobium galegae]|uniref:hypothetical protein n=1 Tax=Neorhizobium galegae TaxID=399 RepID=UPI0021050684|nr:hypothetical protein [Neorhizobium galegae]MCQ1856346.1 hypothetical protein [Neorhizobium galegae]
MPRIPEDQIDAVLALVDADIDKSLQRLFDLIRIPSISTDPGYRDQCKAAAAWPDPHPRSEEARGGEGV